MFNDFTARVAPTVVGYNCVLIGKMVSDGEGLGVTPSVLDYKEYKDSNQAPHNRGLI